MPTEQELRAQIAAEKSAIAAEKKAKTMARIQQALANVPALEGVKPTYVKYGSMGIEEVSCKLCGNPVRHLAPDDRFHELREIKGKKVVVERLVLVTLPTYREVKITFDDNSHHVTVVCSDCVSKITPAILEDIYSLDLAEMLRETGSLPWELMADRVPVSFTVFGAGEFAL